jgi:hypothetical protein
MNREVESSGIVRVPLEQIKHPSEQVLANERSFAQHLAGYVADDVSFEYVDKFDDNHQDCLGLFHANCSRNDALNCSRCKIQILKKQSKSEMYWTIAHEVGHYVAHRKAHIMEKTRLGGYLEEGFAQVFAMIALPNHERAKRMKFEAKSIPAGDQYLNLVHNGDHHSESQVKQKKYHDVPLWMARRLHEFKTIDDFLDHLYTHLKI